MATLLDRALAQLPTDACVEYPGALRDGYGAVKRDGRTELAHRVAFELVVGPIPEGLVLDHTCRNRPCVNPSHLEAVTQRTNLLRGETIAARHAARTVCVNGHPLEGDNVRLEPRGRYVMRRCRTCVRDRARERRAR